MLPSAIRLREPLQESKIAWKEERFGIRINRKISAGSLSGRPPYIPSAPPHCAAYFVRGAVLKCFSGGKKTAPMSGKTPGPLIGQRTGITVYPWRRRLEMPKTASKPEPSRSKDAGSGTASLG